MVGSVSAASENEDLQITNDTDTVSGSEDTVISASDSDEVLGATGTFTELQSLINANYGKTITLQKDYEYTSGDPTDGIKITSAITIEGNGKTINGKWDEGISTRVFFINGSNVIINKIKMININYNTEGPAIFVDNIVTNFKITNSEFEHCSNRITSNVNGGAIQIRGTYAIIDKCNFTDCYAGTSGGAINFNNAATCYNGTVSNCNFINCSCNSNGGAIETYSPNSTYKNLTFRNCRAGGSGGAFVLWQNCPNVSIIDCKFYNNNATRGGAVCVNHESNKNASITGCIFEGNNASNIGGALVFNAQYGSVKNCNFSNNNATNYGGAVYASAPDSTVDNCKFENNVASDGNNFYATSGNSITITNCGFDEFYVSDTGTGDGLRYGSPTSFTNAIQSIESGGIIYFIGTFTNLYSKSIEKSVIIQPYNNGNVVINLQGKSARAFTISADNVVIKDITFQNSLITGDGGVLYWTGANGVVSDCTFKSNQAANGGAIYWTGTNGTVTGSTFESNTATTSGGAIYWSGEEGSVLDSTFKQNSAVNGGSIYVGLTGSGSEFELKDSTFTSESGTYGIIYAHDIGTLSLGGNTFASSCSATYSKIDGVYYYPDGEEPSVTADLVYVSPTGTGDGLTANTPTTWTNAIDKVEEGGKIVFLNYEFTNIISQTITKTVALVGSGNTVFNGASKSGKFFTVSASGVTIENITFKNNANGAIEWNGANGEITNCNFTSNAASAGAIKWTGSTGTISNCIFTGNTLNIANTGSLTLKSNTFNEVTASLDSKQITYSGGNVALTGSFNAKTSGIAFSGISISVTNMASVSASVSASGAITATIPAPIPNQYTITLANTDSNGNKFVYSATPTNSVSVRATDIYISPSGTGSGVSASTPTTWDNVADKLTDTGTVHFTDSTAYSLSGKTISKSWTLTSSGASNVVINGGSSTIFSITSSDVTIEKLTLISTTHPITASTTVTVRNSVLQNQIELNKASSYVYGDTITITGSFGNISPSTISAYSGTTLIGTSSGSTASYTITRNGNLAVGSYTLTHSKINFKEV